MSESAAADNLLGAYLKDRRTRLDAAAFGFSGSRRRTPGLRREEVAQRANISSTWYTWLEQGRGGAPSADVLDRIARALMLTDVEREHLFLIGLGRPPEVRYQASEGVSPRLQRVLDALSFSPALVRTATWDVVAWNRAASVVLTDYGAIPPDSATSCASSSVIRAYAPRNMTGTVWRASWWPHSGQTRRGQVPSRMSPISSTSSVGQVRNSRRSGATMTCAIMATAPSGCGIPFTARCRSNIRASMSRAAPISA